MKIENADDFEDYGITTDYEDVERGCFMKKFDKDDKTAIVVSLIMGVELALIDCMGFIIEAIAKVVRE